MRLLSLFNNFKTTKNESSEYIQNCQKITSDIFGRVEHFCVIIGQHVTAGDIVMTIRNKGVSYCVCTRYSGVVTNIVVKEGELVDGCDTVLILDKDDEIAHTPIDSEQSNKLTVGILLDSFRIDDFSMDISQKYDDATVYEKLLSIKETLAHYFGMYYCESHEADSKAKVLSSLSDVQIDCAESVIVHIVEHDYTAAIHSLYLFVANNHRKTDKKIRKNEYRVITYLLKLFVTEFNH